MLRSLAVAALAAVVRCAAGDVDDPGVAVALSVNNLACAVELATVEARIAIAAPGGGTTKTRDKVR